VNTPKAYHNTVFPASLCYYATRVPLRGRAIPGIQTIEAMAVPIAELARSSLIRRVLYSLRRLVVKLMVGLAAVYIVLLILSLLSARSDFIAANFGPLVPVSLGAIWLVRMIWTTHSKAMNEVHREIRTPPIVVESVQVSSLLTGPMTKPLVSLTLVFLFSFIQLVTLGKANDYLFLVTGSCLSGAAIFGSGLITKLDRRQKSWLPAFLAFSDFVPYGFGCYLIFYRGFWRLFTRFTVQALLASVLFAVLGYQIVNGMYLLSELGDKARKKEIILK
jgi:hypothetical protein